MKKYELSQEEKDTLIYYHWKEGTLWEDDYYHLLFDKYDWLENVYNKSVQDTINELGYGGENYEYQYDEYDEWLLFLMQTLDEKLNVGLYEGEY